MDDTKILAFLGNVRHNGNDFKAGHVVQMSTVGLEQLIADGTIRVMEGVESVAKAVEILAAAEAMKVQAAEDAEQQSQQQNTWGPKPDAPAVPETKVEEKPAAETTDTTAQTNTGAPTVGGGDQAPTGDTGANL